MPDQEQLNQELTILAQEDPAGFQRIIDGLEEGKPFVLENQQLVHDQLIFLVQRDRTGFDRAVQALEDLKIDEGHPAWCFMAYYANEDTCTDITERIDAQCAITDACKDFIAPPLGSTAAEWCIAAIGPNEPLDEEEQAFLTLCKLVREGVNHAV